MIQNGYKPRWSDHRDLDFLKSHKLGAVGAPTTYIEFSVDPGFPIMNQNAMALPYGCTGMAQGYLCSCEDQVIADPAEIYDNTPPGGRTEGRDIRVSLKRICTAGYRKYLTNDKPANPRDKYFSIRAQGLLDWFDAIYISLLSTLTEKRAATIGMPWFPEFENVGSDGILPMPSDLNPKRASWHNAAISKGKFINGKYYLAIQSWQGESCGDKGWCYADKALINAILEIQGTEILTVSKLISGQVQKVDLTIVETIVSFITNLLANINKYGFFKSPLAFSAENP